MNHPQHIIEDFLDWMLHETDYIIAEMEEDPEWTGLNATNDSNGTILRRYIEYLEKKEARTEAPEIKEGYTGEGL